MIDRGKEVAKMIRKINARRLIAAGLLVGALSAVAPTASLAANGGGGPRPQSTISR
ncbi:MAG: hypothetical protein M3R70_01355 [Actinomycetota bacterium]|nr:hypothetical protein [Actinomycetota bacterium]